MFRKVSIDRINSPEQLSDYLRVTNPAMWLVLVAVILLVGGFLVWASVGHITVTVEGKAVVAEGTATVTVGAKHAEDISSGQPVTIGSADTTISEVTKDMYGRAIASAETGKTVPDGEYTAVIETEDITPISFLFN